MPHAIIEYTHAEVVEILTAHAIGLVAGSISSGRIDVEFSKNVNPNASPEVVSFTRARVAIPQPQSGPRRGGTTVEQPGPVPPRRGSMWPDMSDHLGPRRIETADDIRLAGGLGSGIAGERE